jgi:hypothetical protein
MGDQYDMEASPGSPRIYELIQDAPKEGKSPTIWAWPEVVDMLKVAGQPVPGPWPPHQRPRPDPEAEEGAVAVREPDEEARHIEMRRGMRPGRGPASPYQD